MSAPPDRRTTDSADLAGISIAVLGCGAVGSALARELAARGATLLLWSRTAASAEAARDEITGVTARLLDAPRDAAVADVVLITVADPVLQSFVASLANDLAQAGGGRIALHTNGSCGLDVLAPLAARGWATGKLHPLVAVSPRAGARAPDAGLFANTWFAWLASEAAAPMTLRLIEALEAHPLALDPADPQASLALHTAAALLSGGLVALFDMATATAGADSAQALRALLASTLANLERSDARDALTGPIARGAVDSVRAQLGGLDEDAAFAYRALGRRMLALGVARGTVSAEARAELEALLE